MGGKAVCAFCHAHMRTFSAHLFVVCSCVCFYPSAMTAMEAHGARMSYRVAMHCDLLLLLPEQLIGVCFLSCASRRSACFFSTFVSRLLLRALATELVSLYS